ncbi:hypothetical protein [Spirosoma luteum]|uniref:hypothetical protein n=1 Tax=Spirosoma luteum TaxID=431553 RepID=UPI000361D1C1|nr:hypothetical protein [Spirosoma luteum]
MFINRRKGRPEHDQRLTPDLFKPTETCCIRKNDGYQQPAHPPDWPNDNCDGVRMIAANQLGKVILMLDKQHITPA